MICPHCGVGIRFEESGSIDFVNENLSQGRNSVGAQITGGFCSECNGLILFKKNGIFNGFSRGDYEPMEWWLQETHEELLLYPKNKFNIVLPSEIPLNYVQDFMETYHVCSISAKASAAISRRILQQILVNEYGIERRNLSQQIDDFIVLPGIPSYLADSIDAVRQIGNFAAHPVKSLNSGEVVEVEEGEAEWILEVLQSLFDFVFVQPSKQRARIDKLNQKLHELGKPQLKSSSEAV